MHLDRLDRDKERLGDLLVARTCGRHLRDSPLARCKRVEAAQHDRAAVRARRGKFVVRALEQSGRTALLGELESRAQVCPSFAAAVRTPQRGTEIDQRPRVLEPSVGSGEHLDRIPKQHFP
jgi:hypothetical protein